jgi:hypothetical protein
MMMFVCVLLCSVDDDAGSGTLDDECSALTRYDCQAAVHRPMKRSKPSADRNKMLLICWLPRPPNQSRGDKKDHPNVLL